MNKIAIIAKITSFIGTNHELLSYAFIKLFTTNTKHERWFYSDLSGALCMIFDLKEKVRYFILYDINTYQVLFKYQLYFEFDKYYQILSEDFHCFEIDNGLIGLKFSDKKEANKFTLNVIKYDDMHTIQYFKSKNNKSNQIQKKSEEMPFTHKCMILKKKLMKKFNLSNTINRLIVEANPAYISFLRRFALLKDIGFDKKTKEFNLDRVNDQSKNFFRSIGVRKSDFRNPHLALILFKHILECEYQTENSQRKRSRVYVAPKHNRVSSYHVEMAKRYSLDHVVNNLVKDGKSDNEIQDGNNNNGNSYIFIIFIFKGNNAISPLTLAKTLDKEVDEEINKYTKLSELTISKLKHGNPHEDDSISSPKKMSVNIFISLQY